MKNKKGILIGALTLIILIGLSLFALNYNNAQKNKIDDYYKYINGEVLDKEK